MALSLLATRGCHRSTTALRQRPIITISESVWRNEAAQHAKRTRALLKPGLLTSTCDKTRERMRHRPAMEAQRKRQEEVSWTALDPKHPVYNFLIEYYGIKGAKGPRRLARWSPDPSLLLSYESPLVRIHNEEIRLEETLTSADEDILDASKGEGGIFLQNATPDDLGEVLHRRGAVSIVKNTNMAGGVLYSPGLFRSHIDAAPYLWYRTLLTNTLSAEPILHCHNLHEWAMQYHPLNSPLPPSTKYQSHLPLRVSRQLINETVERRGVCCTHVDAMRYFAPASIPHSQHQAVVRKDQLTLEQPACLHAQMDLLKMALKLQPFIDAKLVYDALHVALTARILDVEASPYDATSYGLLNVVKIETEQGRASYRQRQSSIMKDLANPVRIKLAHAYEVFLMLCTNTENEIDQSNGNKNV